MFYHLFVSFMNIVGPLRVFQYLSFRVPAAALTALVTTLFFFPRFIHMLRIWQGSEIPVREDTPVAHRKKQGTPTMGGLFLLLTVLLSSLLWADLSNIFVWLVMVVLVGFGVIGFMDDYLKITHKNSKGLAGRRKLVWQVLILISITCVWYIYSPELTMSTRVNLPFIPLKWFNLDLGLYYIPFAYLVILGTSHAVNLTDGLDGLAIGPIIVSSSTWLVLVYIAGTVITFNNQGTHVDFNLAEYLNVTHIVGSAEMAIVCAAIAGAGIGFLWYNTFPATVFMGDVGSLALGGALGSMAVLTKNEILSTVLHGVFLVEALSVISQVISFKLTGRRIFKMAPIHHHFELKGWAEPKIIVRFWIMSIILALASLVSLKLR